MTGIEKLLEFSNELTSPNYGAALVFELRKDKRNDEYFIKVLKKNSIYPGVTKFNQIKIKGLFLKHLYKAAAPTQESLQDEKYL